MTHEAPPANDTRPTKVLKTAEGTTPSDPLADKQMSVDVVITDADVVDSAPPALDASESLAQPMSTVSERGPTNGTTSDPSAGSAAGTKNVSSQAGTNEGGPAAVESGPNVDEHREGNGEAESVILEKHVPDGAAPVLDIEKPLTDLSNQVVDEANAVANGTEMVVKEATSAVEEVTPAAEQAKLAVAEANSVVKEIEIAIEEAKSMADEAKPVVDGPQPVAEEAKPVAEETKPVAEETKLVAEETKLVAEETKPVAEETKPVAEETKPVAEETKPVAEETKPVAEEAKPVPEEAKLVVDKVKMVVDEAKPVADEVKPVAPVPSVCAEKQETVGEQVNPANDHPLHNKDELMSKDKEDIVSAQVTILAVKDDNSANENVPTAVEVKSIGEKSETASEVEKPANTDEKGQDNVTKEYPVDDLSKVSLGEFMKRGPSPVVVDPCSLTDTSSAPLSAEKLQLFHAAVKARNVVWVLLAAGQGSRFVSDVPKVLHPLCGKPLAQHALDVASQENIPVILVVGHAREAVAKTLVVPDGAQVAYVCQEQRMGTGHAVMVAAAALPEEYTGMMLLSYADNPGINHDFVDRLERVFRVCDTNRPNPSGAAILTGNRQYAGPNSSAYGRIVRNPGDLEMQGPEVSDIVEKKTIKMWQDKKMNVKIGGKEWTPSELDQISEFNSGIVFAHAKPYLEALRNAKGSQTKKEPVAYEYYATDFVKCLIDLGYNVYASMVLPNETWRLEGSNTVDELKELEKKMESEGKEANSNEEGEKEEKVEDHLKAETVEKKIIEEKEEKKEEVETIEKTES